MTVDQFTAYQFMVSKFGGIGFNTFEEFELAVKTGKATKRFIPSRTWGMYNIDTKEILAEGYLCRYGFDLVKISKGKVTEYYRRLVSNKEKRFIAYDLDTLQPKEYYRNVENQLRKYDWKTGEQLQANNNCSYESLPKDVQDALRGFRYQRSVFMHAVKPYGRVVEFYYGAGMGG